MRTSILKLKELADKIARLTDSDNVYGGIGAANHRPQAELSKARAVRFTASNGYGRTTDEEAAAAAEMQKRMEAEYLARGEEQRDIALAEINAELEQLRAILPSIAAKAAIEMGVIARTLPTFDE